MAGIHDQGQGDRGGGEDRAHRQVDPLGEDDEGLPDRDQGDHRGLHRNLEQVVDGEEIGGELRQDQPQRQEDAGREEGRVVDDRALDGTEESHRPRGRGQAEEAGDGIGTGHCVPSRDVPGSSLCNAAEPCNFIFGPRGRVA